ncbi:MAG: RHS repeat-associated core domain-containing protein [Rhodococcus sp. (in: high G+C Gram-positive bacteria)]
MKTDGSSEVVTTYEYDAKGRVTRVLDALGNATDYAYDTAGNLATVTRPANDDLGTRPVVSYGYDALGRVTTITEGQAITEITYDAVDRVTQTKVRKNGACNGGEVCEFLTGLLYDQYEAGQQRLWVHQTDANGIVTKQAYDTYGRLVISRDAENNDTRYNYANKHLVGITDANDYTTGYLYDTAGRLWKTIFPDAAEESYTYSADGLLATKTDRKGNVIGYLYDAHKRLVDKVYNNGADGTIHFVYEGQKLVRVENRSQGVNEDHVYTYDTGYRTASEQQGPRGTVRWEYDVRDQVSRMSVDGGPTTDYSYYADGSMNTITWSLVSGQFKYRYTPEGQYATVTFPNGQSRNYSYDWAGRLLQLANLHPTAGNLATYSYGYDVDWATGLKTRKGQRTSMTADVPAQGFSAALTKYYYDQFYQLTGADYPSAAPFNGEVARWTYDTIGNRLTPGNYSYRKLGANPKNSLQLTSVDSGGVLTSFTYDANGNTASRSKGAEALTFGYDGDSRLVSVGGSLTTAYEYDYSGRRVSKVAGGSTSNFLLERQNVLKDDVGSFLFGSQTDEPLARVVAGQVYFYSTDALGSVAALTSSSGDVRNSYSYRAWGEVASAVSSIENPFTYTGRESGEAGMMFYRARYYDGTIGRFAAEDPIRFVAGINFYSYVSNDPVNATDPYGLCDWEVRSRWTRGVPRAEATRHQYFYNKVTGQAIGLTTRHPMRGTFAFNPKGAWEIHEDPNTSAGDELDLALPPGSKCDCITRRIANPGLPPPYCTLPQPMFTLGGKKKPCENCRSWLQKVLDECS